MAATSVFVPTVSCSCLLPLWETLQDQQVGHDPGFYQVITSALGPRACEILYALFVKSFPPRPLKLLKVSPAGLQSQMLWGLLFLLQDPKAGETNVGLKPLTPLGESLQL